MTSGCPARVDNAEDALAEAFENYCGCLPVDAARAQIIDFDGAVSQLGRNSGLQAFPADGQAAFLEFAAVGEDGAHARAHRLVALDVARLAHIVFADLHEQPAHVVA
jgi:uncharacterized protein (DUF1684 family)